MTDQDMKFKHEIYMNALAMLKEGLPESRVWAAISQRTIQKTQAGNTEISPYLARLASMAGNQALEQHKLQQENFRRQRNV